MLWYIGDGELESNSGYIKLHTNSFLKEDVNMLCSWLSNYESKLQRKTDTQYLVTIPRKKVKSFLKTIGDCPISDYAHKWKEVPYKNKNIEKNGVKDYSNIYPLIIKDWNDNKLTIHQLHKKYDIPIKCVKNYFDSNDIKWIPIDNKKPILQFDLNNNLIKEWESAAKIKKELGHSSGAISRCCTGKRKTHKKYIWKFKN